MLRISKLADYATLVMSHLARQSERHANASDIAQATKLSVPTVRKLLKLLATKNLLVSLRGSKGGYALARSSDEISVAQIIAAIEQQAGLTECSGEHSQCELEAQCLVRTHWQVIDRAIYAALESVMLADLIRPHLKVAQVDVSDIHRIRE